MVCLTKKLVAARRRFLAAAIVGLCATCCVEARSQSLTMQFYPLTGEVQLRNKSGVPISFSFYSIESSTMTPGALNSSPSAWQSIADTYDVSGNGFIDPVNNWSKLSAAGSTVELSEGVVLGPGGTLPPMRAISLGNVWNPSVAPLSNLVVEVLDADSQPANVSVEFGLAGDYLQSGDVDQNDYNFWRSYFGSTTLLLADGNLDGVVDAADYVVWRDNFGNELGLGYSEGGGASLVVGTAVPEPSAAALFMLAMTSIAAWASRRVRRR